MRRAALPVKKLTDAFCRSAPPAPSGTRVEYQDQIEPKLSLRVTDKGKKSWIVRYRAVSGQQRYKLGEYPDLLLSEARKEAGDVAQAVRKGKDPAAEKRRAIEEAKTASIRTFNDLADAFLAASETGDWQPKKKPKRARTINDERAILGRYVRPVIGKRAPKDITRRDVKELLRALKNRGIGAQTNRTQAVIRQVFAYAIAEELPGVLYNPATGFTPVVAEAPRSRVFSDAELETAWKALGDPTKLKAMSITRPVAIALQLAMLTPQRESEIAGMALRELDLEQRTWVIPAERCKNGKPHLVPLPDRAVTLIKEALALAARGNADQPEFVFPSPRRGKGAIRGNTLCHAMDKLRTGLGIEGVTVHDLRRTISMNLTSERIGVAPFIRSKVLGHTSDAGGGAAVSMMHYDPNPYVAEKRRALEAWEALLLQIVGERPRPDNVVGFEEAASA